LINSYKPATSKAVLAALLCTTNTLAPSKKKPQLPIRVSLLKQFYAVLDPASAFDTAWFACATMTFWCTSHLGKFTIPDEASFNPDVHVTTECIEQWQGVHPTTVFHLLWPKVGCVAGKNVFWVAQHGVSDPASTLQQHLKLNTPPANGPLFAYQAGTQHWPLTYNRFHVKLYKLCKAVVVPCHYLHSLRIGNTLELLLTKRMLLEEVKAKGCWSSDVFAIYLCKHAEVLAPLIQANASPRAEARQYMLQITQ
jgi:hypothetical protein